MHRRFLGLVFVFVIAGAIVGVGFSQTGGKKVTDGVTVHKACELADYAK